MLDIKDKDGNVVAVLLDDGSVVRKVNPTDDIEELIRQKMIEKSKKQEK